MGCMLCGGSDIKITYQGLIRDGGLGRYTKAPVTMWQCGNCGVIWHDPVIDDVGRYYESETYRNSLEGSSDIEDFYRMHDKETLDKFQYTGTDVFRHKVVADIGCGGGVFLDFLKGVADTVIAVEPSENYRRAMDLKGFRTYAYTEDALKDWKSGIDVATSFDVIEHVGDPRRFMEDIFRLLAEGGHAVIGTPTDAPVMRSLLGETYEQKLLFSTQHPWVFSEKSLRLLAEETGFWRTGVKYFQRYGIGNLLGWLREKEPRSDIREDFFGHSLDGVWKSECAEKGLADYVVLYAYKG